VTAALTASRRALTEDELAALDALDTPAPLYPHPQWMTGGE
jgi:hypothetical protein